MKVVEREKVAIVGPRVGADLQMVEEFCDNLYAKYPETIVVSGGAKGVDQTAERRWLKLGGEVWSYRVKELPDGYGVEKWTLGVPEPTIELLHDYPEWANYKSALFARSWIIASEVADRVVAFYGRSHMRGTEFTVEVAEGHLPDRTYIYQPGGRDESLA